MANLGFEINPEEVAKDHFSSKKLLPPGWTDLVIMDDKIQPSKSGQMIVFKIQDKEGNEIIERLNYINTNEIAQKAARGTLGKIALAVGWNKPLMSTDVLVGKRFQGLIAIEESVNKDGSPQLNDNGKPYPPKNVIKDYRPIQKATTPPVAPTQTESNPW